MRTNEHGQPIGFDLNAWSPPAFPRPIELAGRSVALTPIDVARDTAPLFEVLSAAPDSLWTYMSFGPFGEPGQLGDTLQVMVDDPSWLPYLISVDQDPLGFASYLRIQPRDGVIEIGAITLSPRLQRTTPATEALYSMIRNVFDQGYRRCEWKCDDLNAPSRSAAERLGFTYEGTFAQATHYKGRNRDTAWYAITDQEWPALDAAFRLWLAPDNFDEHGHQKRALKEMRHK